MKQQYLGDSFDIVKRFWAESLHPIAPLYAHTRFIPREICAEYTSATKIPILDPLRGTPTPPFGVLLDPHIGIPYPPKPNEQVTPNHASLSFIVALIKELDPVYAICFDQSYHRKHALKKEEQLEQKKAYLRERGLNSFYYVSHAPFLFVASKSEVLCAILSRLSVLGIPQRRFIVGTDQ